MISVKRDTDEILDPIAKECEADLLHKKNQVCFTIFFPISRQANNLCLGLFGGLFLFLDSVATNCFFFLFPNVFR